MTIPVASYAKMRLGRLTDSHLQQGNPQCGFEFVKTLRAGSRSMQNAPMRCLLVNSEERCVARLDGWRWRGVDHRSALVPDPAAPFARPSRVKKTEKPPQYA